MMPKHCLHAPQNQTFLLQERNMKTVVHGQPWTKVTINKVTFSLPSFSPALCFSTQSCLVAKAWMYWAKIKLKRKTDVLPLYQSSSFFKKCTLPFGFLLCSHRPDWSSCGFVSTSFTFSKCQTSAFPSARPPTLPLFLKITKQHWKTASANSLRLALNPESKFIVFSSP